MRRIATTAAVLVLASAGAGAAIADASPKARAAHDVIDARASCTAASIQTAHFAPGASVTLVVQDAFNVIAKAPIPVGPDGIATIEFGVLPNAEAAVIVSAYWQEKGKPYSYVSTALAVPQPCTVAPPEAPPANPQPPAKPVPPACVAKKVRVKVHGNVVTTSRKVPISVDGRKFKSRKKVTVQYGALIKLGCGALKRVVVRIPEGKG